ncbi:MAG TPA: ribonuclease P protein component [Candidatus Azoamicus sp. OHIO1]
MDINNIIKFGWCNIFNYGFFYYKVNMICDFNLYIKIPKKECFYSVDRNLIKRIIKKNLNLYIFKFLGYDVVIVLNQVYASKVYSDDIFFI